MSTRCFGNKSSLTLFRQQSFTPPRAQIQSYTSDKQNYDSIKFNSALPSTSIKQNSFRIMNNCQPFLNSNSLNQASENIISLSSNQDQGQFLTQNGGVSTFERPQLEKTPSKVNIHGSLLKRERFTESLKSEHRNESLIKEHLNFINGIRQQNLTQKNSFSAEQERQIELELRQKLFERNNKLKNKNTGDRVGLQDDDDSMTEDIVLESDINNRLIENYDKYLSYSNKSANQNSKKEDLACLEIIETLNNNLKKESDPHLQTVFTSTLKNSFKNNLIKKSSFQALQKALDAAKSYSNEIAKERQQAAERNDNCIQNDQARASPTYIRERYYQILRDQVFPFLQRPPQSSININQSAKQIQGYSNDVLY